MLSVQDLSKRYPTGTLALTGMDLTVEAGEILAIVGGSGCGKSTLLRLVAGLETPTTGSVVLDGTPVRAPRAEIGLVFQEPRLLPWLTVRQNVGFGLRELPEAERRRRVDEVLARVGLADFADAWPRDLSGGMAQRVALARALVARPRVLLLDEPFSALDALTRYDLQDHLLQLWEYDRPTMVLVTHDIEEALVLADRIIVLQPRPGRIQAAFAPGLSRPRDRTDPALEAWKRRLLGELDLSFKSRRTGEEQFPAAAI
ncbi:ABC transporter ATP-binding protein [Arenibaculum pallidiluteum]|uniref:ABC transporter ATP-binding protein n=1 Tax=Arenibaculum pallidiluteum TaxID=2812559 RepID=UPI001A957751|nr:ABC transporter ATP-binding protein [Arenibaculum pallidiluteum]